MPFLLYIATHHADIVLTKETFDIVFHSLRFFGLRLFHSTPMLLVYIIICMMHALIKQQPVSMDWGLGIVYLDMAGIVR